MSSSSCSLFEDATGRAKKTFALRRIFPDAEAYDGFLVPHLTLDPVGGGDRWANR